MKHFFIVSLFLSIYSLSYTQNDVSPCGQWEETEKAFENNPEWRAHAEKKAAELEQYTQNFIQNKGGGNEVYIIPIVYHVIYQSEESNISDEQIYSSVEVLNRDFRLQNTDYLNAPEQFSSIAADIQIEFRLAKIDPEGNCTNGINRIYSSLTNEGGSAMKSLIHWPRNKYLNVWVCSDAGGAAGYTFLPSSTDGPWMADEDGIVLLHNYTGAIGTSNSSYSRTLSHEVGHWLNLKHTWGGTNNPELENNCNEDDGVSDTPLTIGHYSTCNQSLESCGSLDNINNYMEYTSCKWMFTEGQKARMRAAVTSSISDRNQLWQESNLIATGVFNDDALCVADFSSDETDGCVGSTITFVDESYAAILERTWDFGDGTSYSTTDPLETTVEHAYEDTGLYNVTITVSDGQDEISETKQNYITIFGSDYIGDALLEGFENAIDENIWSIYNPDNDYAWEEYSGAAYSGNSCLRLRNKNINIENAKDILKSGIIDVSGNTEVYLSYDWAFAQRAGSATDDRLKVQISYNCGDTWATKKLHRGTTDLPTASPTSSTFVPENTSEWNSNTIVIDNPNQITSDFMVKFEFLAKGGNNIYLDNINVYGNSVVGIDEIKSSNEKLLFPNPTADQLTIEIPTDFVSQNTSVAIYDISGRILQKFNRVGKQIKTSIKELSSGIYMVSIIDVQGKRINAKLIVK